MPLRPSREHISAHEVINQLAQDVADAKDNLMVAKISQSYHANKNHRDDPEYEIGNSVMLSTLHQWREHKLKGEKQVAKFMPWFDGPYLIIDIHGKASEITLDIPTQPNAYLSFHMLLVKPFTVNDAAKYPSHKLAEPGPIIVDRVEEYTVSKIVTHWKISCGYQFQVQFKGWGPEHERWIAGCKLEDNEALDIYWKSTV